MGSNPILTTNKNYTMGRLRHFEKIKWKPFQMRIENICVTNYYIDDKSRKCSMQSHLKKPNFSFFEIVKWEANPYFGMEESYRDAGYEDSFGGDFLQKDGHSIQKFFFIKNESCYMIAHWEDIDHDEKIPDLKFVGSRPFELDDDERETFMLLAKIGQEHIQKVLNNFNEEEYD